MAECRGLAPLARRHALVSTEARHARPVDIPDWSAWGDLHSQGCSGLSRTGLLFPANHTPVGAPGLAPARPDSLGKWTGMRVARPLLRFGRPACSLNTYARYNGIPCWNCTSLCGFANCRLNCS